MCLAVPAKVIKIEGTTALVDMMGNQTQADISVLEGVKIGDYVMVHAGFAIQKYDEEEARESLKLIREMIDKENDGPAGIQ